MKAIVLQKTGEPATFKEVELEKPKPKSDEVVVQIKAISINPVDVKTAAGKALYATLQKDNPVIVGWDIAGVITEIGEDVNEFNVGDHVFGMVNFPGSGRAYAEYVTAPAAHLAHKPQNISFEEAAATTLAALTAWQDLHQVQVKTGQKVLIHAASGGVGHFAVQIAKHLGAYVIGTSSAANKDFVRGLGADEHIDYQNQNFEDELSGIDLAIDIVGGENIPRNLKILRNGGTLVSNLGIKEEVADAASKKGIKTIAYLVKSNGDNVKSLADLLEKGIVKAHVYKTFPLEQLSEAHKQVATGHTTGKVIVTI